MVKNLPALQETQVQSLGQKDPLEKRMATHSRILAQRIPCPEEPDGLQSVGCTESDLTEQLTLYIYGKRDICSQHSDYYNPEIILDNMGGFNIVIWVFASRGTSLAPREEGQG